MKHIQIALALAVACHTNADGTRECLAVNLGCGWGIVDTVAIDLGVANDCAPTSNSLSNSLQPTRNPATVSTQKTDRKSGMAWEVAK